MKTGHLTILSGPMFAGKTDTFITMASAIEDKDLMVFYPDIDTRYEAGYVTAHNKRKILAKAIDIDLEDLSAIDEKEGLAHNIFIDEVQFLTQNAVAVIENLVKSGHNVVLAGLDLDSREKPFGRVPTLMAYADKVLKITGKCVRCGAPSNRTYRKVDAGGTVMIGGVESYEPRCLKCYLVGG